MGQKENDVVIGFDDGVMVGHEHLRAQGGRAHDGANARALRQFDFVNAAAHKA